MPSLTDYLSTDEQHALLQQAKLEDLGPTGIDVTSAAMIAPDAQASAEVVPRSDGVVAGLAMVPAMLEVFDPSLRWAPHAEDSDSVNAGRSVGTLSGTLRGVLAVERTMLNILGHLSGVATLTRRYVDATAGTSADIYDTRKTLPGLRGLQKYAVVCGGGKNHRIGLHDAVLIKDNHLAAVPVEQLARRLSEALGRADAFVPTPEFIEVEVDTLEQFTAILGLPIDVVLLDNMTCDQLREAVRLRNAGGLTHQLEASGGVNLDTVADIAATGVDRIAVGALTHSAPQLDIGLDIENRPTHP